MSRYKKYGIPDGNGHITTPIRRKKKKKRPPEKPKTCKHCVNYRVTTCSRDTTIMFCEDEEYTAKRCEWYERKE